MITHHAKDQNLTLTYTPWTKIVEGEYAYIEGTKDGKRHFFGPHRVVSTNSRLLLSSSNGKVFPQPEHCLWTVRPGSEREPLNIADQHKLNFNVIQLFSLKEGSTITYSNGKTLHVEEIHPRYGWVITKEDAQQRADQLLYEEDGTRAFVTN